MLKKLSPRHLDIIRRIVVGQPHVEIERDLGVRQSRISILLNDPLFNAKLQETQDQTMAEFLDVRCNAMEILQEAAPDAAKTVVGAFRNGEINSKPIGAGLQLNCAFDVLDRTGNKAVERSLVGTVDLGKLIAESYMEKHGSSTYEKLKPEAKKATDDAFDVLDVTSTKVVKGDDGKGNGNGKGEH